MSVNCALPIEISFEKISDKDGATVIDCRSVEEFEDGHLQDALSVPLQHLSVLVDYFPCNHDDHFFIYCNSGNRSCTFALYLRSIGFTKCQSIKGGYELIGNKTC